VIPVHRVAKPKGFEAKCASAGRKWLQAHPGARRPRDYWSQFKSHLADGFGQLCGYSAMYSPVGTVDHYQSWKHNPMLAYDWDNYRFAEGWINSSKQTVDSAVLDPYEVEPGWFEITLPSLQLKVTDRVPPKYRARAELTLQRLHLRDDERIIRQRRKWLELHESGRLTLEGLAEVAPLLADAVRRRASSR
jgi:hypothetical protein